MILQIYSVFDRSTQQYGTPMFMISNGQVIRSFGDEINRSDKDNQLFRHPMDFDLYRCGSWDTDTGKFVTEAPVMVIAGKDLVSNTDKGVVQ